MKDPKLTSSQMGRMSAAEYAQAPTNGTVVVLDNVRSAYNVGSAFRSCDAFRVDGIILCGISATPPSAEIHKTALGAELTVKWEHYEDTVEAVRLLRSRGYVPVAVEQTRNSVKLDKFVREEGSRYAFIFGNEVDGVSQEVVDECDFSLEIPQWGTKHSLNVSVCAGIVLWSTRL